jgi:phosphatidylglycerophosphate synthase
MTTSKARALRWGALMVGGVLFAAAVKHVDIRSLSILRGFTIALPLVLVVSGCWHLVRTWAWLQCFPEAHRVGFLRLARVRLAAEAFSYLTLRGIAGEPLKVMLLNGHVDASVVTAAVALERIAFVVGTTLIVGIGSVIAMHMLPLSDGWFRVFRVFAIAAGVVALLVGGVVRGRARYVKAALAGWDRWFCTSISTGRVGRFATRVEAHVLSVARGNRGRVAAVLAATLMCYALMILEAWVIVRVSQASAPIAAAIAIETLSRVASFASSFIPANLGALEASSVAAASAAGLAGAGAALALARRVRGLFWAAVGLALYPRTTAPAPSTAGADAAGTRKDQQTSPPAVLYLMRDPRVRLSPHVRLAGLPLSERVLRAALRAGAETVLVWVDNRPADCLTPHELACHRAFERTAARLGDQVRLVRDVETWRTVVRAFDKVTVVGPGTLVSPALLQRANSYPPSAGIIADVPAGTEWPVSGVLRTTGAEAADVYGLIDALHARLHVGRRPSGEEVSAGHALLAVRMASESEVPLAEQMLRRSSYKSTDAKVARFNRRISLPISVRLIRTPLTANQLSVILVALGFYSAWLFSHGLYLHGVLGAFLSLAASVLDGCDGEIARLKYEESAVGCWIETIGDYSYYVAVFLGLTVGAVRQTGLQLFYWIGTVAMTGTLVSFGLLIYLRSQITDGQPDRLHAIAKARFKAEPTRWSKVIWRISFVATRAAMPYGIMALALVNALPLVVFLAALGAHIYWISLALKLRDLLHEPQIVTG